MINLTQWAIRHGVSHVALSELQQLMYGERDDVLNITGAVNSESYVQSAIRLEASHKGVWLLRNNVGACQDKSGRLIRYGLANESKEQNKRIKSADLVGIRPVLITHEMVGQTIGQFVSREVKAGDWHYTGTAHEQAQQRWTTKVLSLGGDACFANGVGTL